MTKRGYKEATLREVAQRAHVSLGLLYRYFPSKRSVVLRLYDELSSEYASRAAAMPQGPWRGRFMFALTTSLKVLEPHRRTLKALVPILVGDPDEGLLAPSTAFSRVRVQEIFHEAVSAAADAPQLELAAALGRLLYLMHLAVILWWLLDKSPDQFATRGLLELIDRALPKASLALRLPIVRSLVRSGDKLLAQALLQDA